MSVPCYSPSQSAVRSSQLTAFIRHCSKATGQKFATYQDFDRFAVNDYCAFWHNFLTWSAPLIAGEAEPVCTEDDIEHALFFPRLALNYAENLLAGEDSALAIIACHAGRPAERITRGDLRQRVQRAAAGLSELGVGAGDRVVAIAYNDADAVIACLAAATLGATFSAAAPDMGAHAILNRFGQLAPVVLFAHTEQRPGNRLNETLADVVAGLPSLRAVVALGDSEPPSLGNSPVYRLVDLIACSEPLVAWEKFAFNHPLFIMFSSGTTGAPKCIIHGAGGTLLEHLKEHRLHCDLRAGERMFFQTSCAWMMWNWLLTALASRVTIVLYDGPVDHPRTLWSIVAEHDVDVFGTSPAFLRLCQSAEWSPIERHVLNRLRAVLSTGAVLHDVQFDWVLQHVKRVPLQSISGGTDIIGCFVLGNPNLPVWRGEAQCRSLALAVDAAGAEPGEVGELVCRTPFPSRPLGFFGDSDGSRFHDAYFSQNPGIWTHGDRISLTPHGSARLHGRSDGVLNVRGLRLGTAEIYSALQDIPELLETMVVEQEMPDTTVGSRIVLLAVLRPEASLTSDLSLRIRRHIAQRIAAAFVPAVILDVASLPTTHSGKPSEAAARDAVNGRQARNRAALRNPECLDAIAGHSRLHPSFAGNPEDRRDRTTEEALQDIWSRAFGLEDIGLNDDFFDLGGDSLLAVQVCTGIEKVFGYDVPIGTLLRASTIAALARVIDEGIVWQGDSPMVTLREGSGRPLFLLHSMSGNVFEWQPLVARLKSDRPIEAIQARGLNPAATPCDSIEAMAEDYVTLIRARQQKGPYSLLGFSMGGLLAYEIALQLLKMGETVEFVGLIDTDVQDGALPFAEKWRFRRDRLLDIGARIAAMHAAGGIGRIWQRVRHGLIQAPVALDGPPGKEGLELPPLLHRVRVACAQAWAKYDPPHYPGEVVLFYALERRPRYADPLPAWRQRVADLRVINIPAGHWTIMTEPNVAALANEINVCLRDGAIAPEESVASNASHELQATGA
ncbi:Acetoacetate--CoA ligase [Rhodovastum atsumiense]|uniref:Acetoacetate--CoA ligase n=1 Tax=Rhodovastum atsumiense TaxID=504468 RepID=A0A5M6J214_9PROT|nr:acetoacetate--CoA ligase [Rhodovastum atsumiense]KAA5614632.1 acetoacetate--CoA ligase [Rhodovastum atsumiense]CAH2599855.1 Acetoacetate--CoA ligase [Rhodovastum atsumiense]